MKKNTITIIYTLLCTITFSQTNWRKGGNNATGVGPPSIGTNITWNSPLNIMTSGVIRAQFTTNNSLNTAIIGNSGDGLRIFNQTPNGTAGNLDLYTSSNAGQNETHIVFGGNGQISGQGNRFELRANAGGFYFNTQNGGGMYKFTSSNTVHAFVGTNKFWRIGQQVESAQIQATRQLEVADNITQFRLRKTQSNGQNLNIYTDFYASNFGLDIKPIASGSKKTVFIHQGGATLTSVKLNVNGNGRFRYVPQGNGESILLGKQVGSNPNDLKFRRLAFSGNVNEVLLGNGTWGTLPSSSPTLISNEGISIIGNYIKLGEIYNNQQTKPLISDREIA